MELIEKKCEEQRQKSNKYLLLALVFLLLAVFDLIFLIIAMAIWPDLTNAFMWIVYLLCWVAFVLFMVAHWFKMKQNQAFESYLRLLLACEMKRLLERKK